MNNNTPIDSLLDDFLRGLLSQDELEQLMKQESVTDITAEINLHRLAAAALQRYSVLEQVQRVHTECLYNARNRVGGDKTHTSAKIVYKQPLSWIIRAAAIVFLVAGGWLAYQYTNTSSTSLYAEIYQPYNLNTNRTDNIGIKPHNIIEQFKDKDYKAVINTFRSLPVTSNREKFLAAYAWHETGEYKQAISVLQQILNNNNTQNDHRFYNDEAEFYLGLSYLKMADNKTAFTYFEKIRNNSNHTYYERVNKWTMMKLKWLT